MKASGFLRRKPYPRFSTWAADSFTPEAKARQQAEIHHVERLNHQRAWGMANAVLSLSAIVISILVAVFK